MLRILLFSIDPADAGTGIVRQMLKPGTVDNDAPSHCATPIAGRREFLT